MLLDLYFKTIDPTSLNRQGNDRGTQYRTGIYYVDKEDLPVINQAIKLLSAQYKTPIAIEVKPLTNFYPAETYHQDYLDKILEDTATSILLYLKWHAKPMHRKLKCIKTG